MVASASFALAAASASLKSTSSIRYTRSITDSTLLSSLNSGAASAWAASSATCNAFLAASAFASNTSYLACASLSSAAAR